MVPGDYYEQFARSARKSLQQLSGISLGGSNRLFPSLVDIHRCLELSVQDAVPAPTLANIISVSDENPRQIWEDLSHKAFVRRINQNTCQPVRHPHRLRYAHLDLAINGLAGIAICHLADLAPARTAFGAARTLRAHKQLTARALRRALARCPELLVASGALSLRAN